MNRTAILVVGKNDVLSTGGQWDVVTAADTEAAIEKFQQMNIDVVVFTNGTSADEVKIRKLFSFQQPGIIFLQNNNSELINGQVKAALQKREQASKRTFSFVDDALKAAELPIIIQ